MNNIKKEQKLWKKWVKARYKLAASKIAPEKEEKRFFEWKHIFIQSIVEKEVIK